MKRRLNNLECLLWKWGSISLNVVMTAVIDGIFSKKELQDALSKLQEHHPLLKVRIELDANNHPWFTSKDVPEIKICHKANASPKDWLKVAHEELAMSHDWQRGPLVRLTILTGNKNTELIVNCHHCIVDGLAVAYLIQNLLTALNDPSARPDESESKSAPLLQHSIPKTISINPALRVAIALANALFGRSTLREPVHDLGKAPCSVIHWKLNRTQTKALIAKCRKEGVSVHSAITTAFQAAQYEVQGENKYYSTIYTPVNIRTRLAKQVGKTFGLYFSEVYIKQKYCPKKDFWEMAHIFQKIIIKATTDQKLLVINKLIEKVNLSLLIPLMLKQVRKPRIRFGYMISNLGHLIVNTNSGPYRIKEFYGPMAYVNCAEKSVGIATIDDKMYFSLTWLTSILDDNIVNKIREKVVKNLDKATVNNSFHQTD